MQAHCQLFKPYMNLFTCIAFKAFISHQQDATNIAHLNSPYLTVGSMRSPFLHAPLRVPSSRWGLQGTTHMAALVGIQC